MNHQIKIVTIGGGSSYTPEFANGLILRSKTLPVSEWWLVDIEEGKEKMEIVAALAQRMFKKAKLSTKIYTTLDRRSALRNADFVTTQFRVGGLDARIVDEKIPLKYHVIGQETNGAGGIFKALRTIPIILDICKDIHEICPDAWLINFTNPAGMITQAAVTYGKYEKTIGLCNIPIETLKNTAKILGEPEQSIDFRMAGFNHFVWGLHAYVDGRDRMPELIDYLIHNTEKAPANFKDQKWPASILQAMNALPCPYHRYYFMQEKMLEEELKDAENTGVRAEVVKKIESELFQLYKNPNLNEQPEQLKQRGGAYYSDAACGIIEAIYCDSNVNMVVDTINNGNIKDIPDNTVIEATCTINRSGAVPLPIENLPQWMKQWLQLVSAYQNLTVKAGAEGDYNALLHAFYINPTTPSGEKAAELIQEMMLAHKKYLPQFYLNKQFIT